MTEALRNFQLRVLVACPYCCCAAVQIRKRTRENVVVTQTRVRIPLGPLFDFVRWTMFLTERYGRQALRRQPEALAREQLPGAALLVPDLERTDPGRRGFAI